MKRMLVSVVWLGLLGLGSCGEEHGHSHAGHDHDHDHGHSHGEDGGHVHVAPHGGTLVVLGSEVGHLEFVLDAETGGLTAYVLDGEAEQSVRLAEESLSLGCVVGEASFVIQLEAQASALSGESVGDTSFFSGLDERLKGVAHFGATLVAVTYRGVEFQNVEFKFPEGNE